MLPSAPSGSHSPQPHPARSRAPTTLPTPPGLCFSFSPPFCWGFFVEIFFFHSFLLFRPSHLLGGFISAGAARNIHESGVSHFCLYYAELTCQARLPLPGVSSEGLPPPLPDAPAMGPRPLPWANCAGSVPFPEPFLRLAPGWNRNLNFLVNKPR